MNMIANRDWLKWHDGYETRPDLAARLPIVRSHIARCLDCCQAGPVGVVSICAGDGRDLVGLMSTCNRRGDISAWLVEFNPVLAARGGAAIEQARLGGCMRYVVADATLFSTYMPMVPADLIILAGIFGNLRPSEVPRLIEGLHFLCRPEAAVVWTRNRIYNDGAAALPAIRRHFQKAGFEAIEEELTSDNGYTIGTHRYKGESTPLLPDRRWFEFGGDA